MKKQIPAAVLTLALAATQALAADTGFATQVSGAVAFKDGVPLTPFAKLRGGDLLLLKPGAKLQLVYFESGRQETWGGACVLTVGARESAATNCPPPAVRQLPPPVLSALLRTPDVIGDIRNRSGMVRMRSVPKPDQVTVARETYKSLRAEAAEDDITPELYLFSRLSALNQTGALDEVLAAMEKRQPNNPEIAALRVTLRAQLEGEKKAPQ